MDTGTQTPTPSSSSVAEALVEELLYQLLELPADRRAEALRAMCGLYPAHEATLQRRLALLESELPAAMAAMPVVAFGRFELVKRLGGGMAEVHLATDTRDGSQVVVKILRHRELLDEQTRRSFAHEVMAASRLQHPGICGALEIGSIDGIPYLVQPYVPGITLAEWIRQRQVRGRGLGAPDLELVLGWLEEILRTLHAAHLAGLVHRDCKPSNILLPFQGGPRLLDFGLSREQTAGITAGTPTPMAGTLAYMAPEMLLPRAPSAGPAGDVYAMGVTLYECVALRLPFDANNQQALCRAILLQEPPDPRRLARGLSRGLCRVLAKAMARAPGDRYPSAAAFAEDLARLRRGAPVSLPHRPLWSRTAGFCGRHRWIVLPAAFAAMLLLAVGFAEHALARALGSDPELLTIPARLRAATARAEALVPGWPEQEAALTEWLRSDGEPLAALLPHLRTRIAGIEREQDADPAVAATLRTALAGLETFAVGDRSAVAVVRARLAWARNVSALTLEAPAAAWRATIAAIAEEPRYGGLRLDPQLDLVPLGRDPGSGLFEFYHPRSSWPGSPPLARNAAGELSIHEFSGLVFVLIPAATCLIGEQPFDPAGLRYDPVAAVYARPHTVSLDPFFVSKYEMTQGQWWQLTGERPSSFRVGQRYGGDAPVTYLHPVESINALVCDEVLRRVGLQLPTEAQWEYASGTGLPTLWFFGDDPSLMWHYANINDRRFFAARPGALGTLDVDDGFAFLAPVGRFQANPFGLHDVMGNVAEWCRDECDDYDFSVPAPGDGMRTPHRQDPARSYRGSRYWQSLNKTSSRPGVLPDHRNDGLGLRPVRPLSEARR